MYPDDKVIIHKEFPYTHPIISFFISVNGGLTEGNMVYEIIGPDKDSILKAPPTQYVDKSFQKAQLTIGIGNLSFPKPGEYKVVITFPNQEKVIAPFFLEAGENI